MNVEMPPQGSGIISSFGFRDGDRGAHSARTMMLQDLCHLMAAVPVGAPPSAYADAAIAANALGKQTMANRRNSLTNLGHLYALDPQVVIFRVLRHLWSDHEAQPILALYCALARDPLLRLSAPVVLSRDLNAPADRDIFAGILEPLSDRFSAATRKSISQNFAATWTQSGHLQGVRRKYRRRAQATPAAAAYAATLAFLVGLRGVGLLESMWLKVLDAPVSEVQNLLSAAARADLIDFKISGPVVSLIPRGLLTPPEISLSDQLAHERSHA